MVFLIVLISLFSCSKDTDLLVDYMVSDFQEAHLIGNLAIDDNFVIASQKSIVLDVLANDTFTDPENVKIIEISQPNNGNVIVNDDKTLTYYPDSTDIPKPDTGSETEGSLFESEKNEIGETVNPPAQTDTDAETPQAPVTETPKEEETEPTAQKEESKQTETEDFTYTVETTDEKNNKTTQEATVTITTYDYPPNAVFASSFGFTPGDATEAFKAAIKSGSSYVVIDKQSSDWVIRPTRFFDLHDMTIVFEPGVTLQAKPGEFRDGDRLFKLSRAKNVTVEGTGATFKMNKNEYTIGEQRHAFEMDMSSDITVRGLTIRDSGGAGLKIMGKGKDGGYCENITVENVRSLNNRRDGITISSATNVWVRNSEFSGSSGTRPEAGVVLEADHPVERLVNINFINCKFSDNQSAGVHFTAFQMNSSSQPISIKFLDCEFSNNAIAPPAKFLSTEVEIGGGSGTDLVGGEIRFERILFNGSRGRIVFTKKSANGFKAVFKDCQARNVVSATAASPIGLEANQSRNTLGGIEFDNFHIQYDRNVPFMQIRAPSNFQLKDVRGSFTIEEPGDSPPEYVGGYRNHIDQNINVSIDYKHM